VQSIYLVLCICNHNLKEVLVETFFGEILSEKKKWVATSTHEILGEKSSKLAKFQKKRKSLPYFRL